MKKLSKLFALLLTASALVFGFASCANGSSDDDDDNGPSLATFTYVEESEEMTISAEDVADGAPSSALGKKYKYVINYTLYFYDSNFTVFTDAKAITTDGKILHQEKSIEAKGTYKLIDGDFSNGTVEYQLTELNDDQKAWYSGVCPITDGTFEILNIEFSKQ